MRFLSCGLIFALLGLAGCDSMPEGMRQRFAPQPQIRVIQAEEPAVFEAAQHAVKEIGFRVTRSGRAQGVVNGISEIQPANALGEARQYVVEVKLQSFESGRTEVSVLFREQQESSSFAGATDIPLRQHGLYDSYFNAVQAALGSPAGAAAAK